MGKYLKILLNAILVCLHSDQKKINAIKDNEIPLLMQELCMTDITVRDNNSVLKWYKLFNIKLLYSFQK